MKRFTSVLLLATLTAGLLTSSASAHPDDLMTANGRVGPIRTGETTTRHMKEMFGEPRDRDVVRVGCSRVVRLRWRGIQIYAYRQNYKVVDVKVNNREVRASQLDRTYTFHTRRGLNVGDSQRKVKRLYPKSDRYRHAGHTHYILGESRYGTRLLAKVIDGKVVQLETAPYEFC